MKKKILVLFFILILGCVIVFLNLPKQSGHLTFYGNVETHTVNASFRVGGRIQELYFEEGDFVNKGDLLARLDSLPFEKDVDLAKAEKSVQESSLTKFLKGSRDAEIMQGRNIVQERKAMTSNLKQNLDRLRKLRVNGGISQQDLDDAHSRHTEAAARLKASQNQLSLLEEGFREEDIAQQKAAVLVSNARYEKAKIFLTDTSLFAPQSGRIITKTMEQGAMINAGHTLYSISIPKPIRIRAYIVQNKMGLVSIGDKVSISSDSAPQNLYYGHIAFISSVAEFTPKSVETEEVRNDLVYRMRIIVDENENTTPEKGYSVLHQGMPVTIKFLTNSVMIEESLIDRIFN